MFYLWQGDSGLPGSSGLPGERGLPGIPGLKGQKGETATVDGFAIKGQKVTGTLF